MSGSFVRYLEDILREKPQVKAQFQKNLEYFVTKQSHPGAMSRIFNEMPPMPQEFDLLQAKLPNFPLLQAGMAANLDALEQAFEINRQTQMAHPGTLSTEEEYSQSHRLLNRNGAQGLLTWYVLAFQVACDAILNASGQLESYFLQLKPDTIDSSQFACMLIFSYVINLCPTEKIQLWLRDSTLPHILQIEILQYPDRLFASLGNLPAIQKFLSEHEQDYQWTIFKHEKLMGYTSSHQAEASDLIEEMPWQFLARFLKEKGYWSPRVKLSFDNFPQGVQEMQDVICFQNLASLKRIAEKHSKESTPTKPNLTRRLTQQHADSTAFYTLLREAEDLSSLCNSVLQLLEGYPEHDAFLEFAKVAQIGPEFAGRRLRV